MAIAHFFFGLSQFHGHGSWLVCEVALKHSLYFSSRVSQVSFLPGYPLKDNAIPTGLVSFWENDVQNFYSIAPNGVLECQIEHLRKIYTSRE